MEMARFTVDIVAPGWAPRIISENPSHYRGYSDHDTLSASLIASEAQLARCLTQGASLRQRRARHPVAHRAGPLSLRAARLPGPAPACLGALHYAHSRKAARHPPAGSPSRASP